MDKDEDNAPDNVFVIEESSGLEPDKRKISKKALTETSWRSISCERHLGG